MKNKEKVIRLLCRFVNEELRERWKMEVTDSTFEDMIDQLEKSSGQYPKWFIPNQIFGSGPAPSFVPGPGSMACQKKSITVFQEKCEDFVTLKQKNSLEGNLKKTFVVSTFI